MDRHRTGHCLVHVDLTAPTARIISTELDSGDESGNLIIGWEAADDALAARPVSLLFAAGPDGPWTKIATGLGSRGRYAWRLDGLTLDSVFLRLDANDTAGNVAIYQTPQPVAFARLRPPIGIRTVRLPGSDRRPPPKRLYFP